MNRFEGFLGRIFLGFISLIFTLILIEVASNYYLWNIAQEKQFRAYASINQIKEHYGQDFFIKRERKNDVIYVPHHYLGYITTSNYESGENRHNVLGFRGEEITVEKPESTYRIVSVGASTTYGTDVENYRHSYPYQLQEYLHQKGYDSVEVINAGIGGYSSFEILMNLQFRVLELKPDLVIIYEGINDIDTRLVYPPEVYRGDNSGHRAPFIQDTVMPSVFEYSTALRIVGINLGWFESQSSISWTRTRSTTTTYDGIFRQSYDLGTYPEVIVNDIGAMYMLEHNPPIYFANNATTMALASQAVGSDVLFSTFATSQEFDNANVSSDVYMRGMEEHNEVTEDVAEKTDSYFFDLASQFPQDKKYFTDGRHMTLEGNALRAQMLGDYIIETILPTPSS